MQTVTELIEKAAEHHRAGRIPQAVEIYEKILTVVPGSPPVAYLLGTALIETAQLGIAATLLTHALLQDPTSECANNLATVMRRLGHDKAAIECYERAIKLDPNNHEARANYAGYWINNGQPERCVRECDEVLKILPDDPRVLANRAIGLLELGRWEEAWPAYMNRYRLPNFTGRNYPAPAKHWSGERTAKLAVHGEQGVGDEILFMSYLDRVLPLADEVIIECEPRLVPLFSRSFGVRCYGTHDELLAAEAGITAYCPMGTLPVYVGPLPDVKPGYLMPDAERVAYYRAALRDYGPGPYVALSWKGGTRPTHQHLRNTGIDAWRSLVAQPADFISVQYGDAGQGHHLLGIPHWKQAVESLDEMAALLKACDLAVSVCNSTVHLAGAVGTPCWVATPLRTAWRYQREGERMPWYDSVRLFRQTKDGDWAGVFQRLEAALADLIGLSRTESQPARRAA